MESSSEGNFQIFFSGIISSIKPKFCKSSAVKRKHSAASLKRPASFQSIAIIVIGNLGRDPELRYTPQGDAVCDFSIATNEKKRDKAGELQDITTWFRVTLWRKQAENASKYLTKGSPVYIEGRLRVEEWTDKDGKTRYNLEINATDMQFISGGRNEGSSSSAAPENDFSDSNNSSSSSDVRNSPTPTDDDIPF